MLFQRDWRYKRERTGCRNHVIQWGMLFSDCPIRIVLAYVSMDMAKSFRQEFNVILTVLPDSVVSFVKLAGHGECGRIICLKVLKHYAKLEEMTCPPLWVPMCLLSWVFGMQCCLFWYQSATSPHPPDVSYPIWNDPINGSRPQAQDRTKLCGGIISQCMMMFPTITSSTGFQCFWLWQAPQDCCQDGWDIGRERRHAPCFWLFILLAVVSWRKSFLMNPVLRFVLVMAPFP